MLFDAILLHQVLQVHDMISNSLPPDTLVAKSINAFWSGIFDLSVFALIVLGLIAFWRSARIVCSIPTSRVFFGSLLFGWGFFNLYDVVTFHALLRFHDVIEATSSPWAWNLAWGVMGALIAYFGWHLLWRGLRPPLGLGDARGQGPAAAEPGSAAYRAGG